MKLPRAYRAISGSGSSMAFTLMEVLLAMAVSAVVLGAIGGVFFSALRLRDRTTAMLDEAAPLQQTLNYLRRDLQGAAAGDGEMTSAFETQNGEGAMGGNFLIRFRTTTGLLKDSTPWADVQEVGYELRAPSSPTGGKELYRTITRNLLSTTGLEADEQFLLGNVQTLEFACYDGANWQDSWDTSMGTTTLPTAVRVRLQLAGPNGANNSDQQPFELIVPLVAHSRTNQTSSTGSL